ncbi:hypothetical protein BVRB_020640, partial [Beta vulgaris subsp. vulgaris]
ASKYKTEMCRLWSEQGQCPYNQKCQFAHGEPELRPLHRHHLYKTVKCRRFHDEGFCPFGPRCAFIHKETSAQIVVGVSSPAPVTHSVPMALPLDLLLPIAAPDAMRKSTKSLTNDILLRPSQFVLTPSF